MELNSGALSKLYTRTIESHHCVPKDGELDSWKSVLGEYRESQLDAALRRWDRETDIEEYTQKPKGSRMPSAAELKRSMDQFENINSDKFIPCDKCEFGWVRVFTGQTAGHNRVDQKFGAVKRCECFERWAQTRKHA